MITTYKRKKKLFLIGLEGTGKSRLGNKLLGKNIFYENDCSKSLAREVTKAISENDLEIIDSPGMNDDDKDNISLLNEIKKAKPNILAYVINAFNQRFDGTSRKFILEICKIFDNKNIWNNFIIIFTFSKSVKKELREKKGNVFSDDILNVLSQYYENNKVKDNSTLPKQLKYYFVELGDNEYEFNLDQETINNLSDIKKLTSIIPPMKNINEKVLEEIRLKKKCKETIRIYDRILEDKYGTIKSVAANVGSSIGSKIVKGGLGIFTIAACISAGIVSAPAFMVGGAVAGAASAFADVKIFNKIKEVDFHHKVDEKFQNEDFIIYDEETYIYHDGTTEVKKINVEKFSRIIPK